MSVELRGLLAAIVAGLAVVGISYGLSALLAPAAGGDHHARPQQQSHGGKAPGSSVGVVSAQMVSAGRGLYAQACASCHGDSGEGGFGPGLQNTDLNSAQIATVIKNGVKPKMPAFGGKFSDAQIQSTAAYVQTLKK